MKLKLKMFMKVFTKKKNYLNSAIIQKQSNNYDQTNDLFVCKIKVEASGMSIKNL